MSYEEEPSVGLLARWAEGGKVDLGPITAFKYTFKSKPWCYKPAQQHIPRSPCGQQSLLSDEGDPK